MIPIVHQEGIKDCGVSCMLSIIKYYKGNINLEYLRELTNTTNMGVTFMGLKNAFNELGFSSTGVEVDDINLLEGSLPAIAQVVVDKKYNHFVVIYSIDKKKKKITIMDPSKGIITIKQEEFFKLWTKNILIVKKQREVPNFTQSNQIKSIIIQIISTNKKAIINIFLFALICTGLSILNSYYFKILIDDIVTTKNINNLYLVIIAFMVIAIIKVLSNVYKEQVSFYISKKIDYFLITNVYKHILLLPYTYFKNKTTGEIISRINDLSHIRNILTKLILTCLIDLILVIVASLILIKISFTLYMISVITILFYILITILCSKVFKRYIDDNQKNSAIINSFLVESFSSYESIKGSNSENRYINKFKLKYSKLLKNIFNFNNFYCIYTNVKDLVNVLIIIILLGIGTKLVIDGIITIGQLITFNSLLIYFYEPIKNTLDLEPDIKSALNSIKRINTLLNVEVEKRNNKDIKLIKGDIDVKMLSYTYDGYNNIFNKVDFIIEEGQKVLINGVSGVGKSTLVKILMKYYKVPNNKVFIDNIDINYYDINDIRNSISYISQSELLINDTIYENIVYNNKYDDKEFYKACKIAKIDKINTVISEGYNFLIEENGFNLSGGERQRIILARHILLRRNILIIDEGTNALDVDLERTILKELFENMKDKTIIHISHHNENMDLYDKVISLTKEKCEVIKRC